jgi:hypothetical protein
MKHRGTVRCLRGGGVAIKLLRGLVTGHRRKPFRTRTHFRHGPQNGWTWTDAELKQFEARWPLGTWGGRGRGKKEIWKARVYWGPHHRGGSSQRRSICRAVARSLSEAQAIARL